MTEIWRDVPGFPGYQASNKARLRSLPRYVRCRGGVRKHAGGVLKPYISKSTGYWQVKIWRKNRNAHRLIALAWCDGFFDGAFVDHINGNPKDNRPENLEWVTPSENQLRSYRNGRKSHFLGIRDGHHPKSKPVVSKCLTTGKIRSWDSGSQAVRFGFDSGSITRCCQGRIKFHKGHDWQYGIVWSETERAVG